MQPTVYDQFSSAMSVDGGGVWTGAVTSADMLLPMGNSTEAWAAAQDIHANRTYYDVHVNIFTPWSFFAAIRKMIENDLLYCQVGGFSDTRPGRIEFMVGLKKPEAMTEAVADSCIASIPDLPFESFMAPYMPQVRALSDSCRNLSDALAGERERSEHIHELLRKAYADHDATLRRRSVRLALKLSHYLNFWR